MSSSKKPVDGKSFSEVVFTRLRVVLLLMMSLSVWPFSALSNIEKRASGISGIIALPSALIRLLRFSMLRGLRVVAKSRTYRGSSFNSGKRNSPGVRL